MNLKTILLFVVAVSILVSLVSGGWATYKVYGGTTPDKWVMYTTMGASGVAFLTALAAVFIT